MATPALMYGMETTSDDWAMTQLGKHQIESSEMSFLWK